jgi:5-methylcytosine-specific restriction endonuclease McrA
MAAYHRAHRAENPQKHREWSKRWGSSPAGREYRRIKHRLYRAANAEKERARKRLYHQTHPEIEAARFRRRKARKRGAPGSHSACDVLAQLARQKGRCYWCQVRVGNEYHVDHVMPLSAGGSDGPENLVIACPDCNLRKGAQHPMDFAGVLL